MGSETRDFCRHRAVVLDRARPSLVTTLPIEETNNSKRQSPGHHSIAALRIKLYRSRERFAPAHLT